MTHQPASFFDLPGNLRHKADPTLIMQDDKHFRRLNASRSKTTTDLTERLDTTRRAPARAGQEAMERDVEVHRLTSRLRSLQRFGVDLCLGHILRADDPQPTYIGRLGLLDDAGEPLLLDWRSPAAEPFFGATHGNPMGLLRRRRYHWTAGRITDYWDEVYDLDGLSGAAALDEQSAFIRGLGTSRTSRMRDVLSTIAADQDAVVRADSAGALVVDGGPGTGKTVVALHRTAYLLYNDSRLGLNRGGVLFVGPHQPYLAYVGDVLPSLGEDGAMTCTLGDMVAEGADAITESDPYVRRLKSSARWVTAIDTAVRFYEQPPSRSLVVETEWGDVTSTVADWATAFRSPEDGTPHNEAREVVREALVDILIDKFAADATDAQLRTSLLHNDELRDALDHSWTLIDASELVADLWSVPAYLRHAAPWLDVDEVRALHRSDAMPWTTDDLPLLDIARRRLGDPAHSRRQAQRAYRIAQQRAGMDAVVNELMATDDDEMMAAQYRQGAIRDALVDRSALNTDAVDPLAGPFAHIVVDEAQELTDLQWQMLLPRCPSRSFTIVGDRAQARNGFTESWNERLERVGFDRVHSASLRINYRTPEEVMDRAAPVIREVLPDANVPMSIRRAGIDVVDGKVSELQSIIDTWTAQNTSGTGCVIGYFEYSGSDRIRNLTPPLAKGLEFDLVVLIDPDSFGSGIGGAVDRYVAMTRATRQLVVLTS